MYNIMLTESKRKPMQKPHTFPKNLQTRSPKSKEEFAKSLFAVANTIHGAVFVSILVLPLAASIQALVTNGAPPVTSVVQLTELLNWLQIPFAVFLFASVWLGVALKKHAMDLLDSLPQSHTTRTNHGPVPATTDASVPVA
ncbi:hypothetical protein [Sinimarinibacterium flocculans]|uniref:hypothetical protein n=1 Tax=Sinimarinibacterium flocculans TaxID=985250 RepID=UPI0035123A26